MRVVELVAGMDFRFFASLRMTGMTGMTGMTMTVMQLPWREEVGAVESGLESPVFMVRTDFP